MGEISDLQIETMSGTSSSNTAALASVLAEGRGHSCTVIIMFAAVLLREHLLHLEATCCSSILLFLRPPTVTDVVEHVLELDCLMRFSYYFKTSARAATE